ncbi:hypothetical protein [Candidatus Venteria ishoeyi]|nr:hypothetical protein [Candidatus Venteria ishoeyi]
MKGGSCSHWSHESPPFLIGQFFISPAEMQGCREKFEDHSKISAPLRETVFAAMQSKPKLMQRKKIFQRVMDALMDIVQRFDEGMGDI